jgi:hypothetical protein
MRYKPSDFEWTAIKPMLPNCLAGALWPDLQGSMVLVLLVTIASSGGSRLASGTRSWMRLLPPMTAVQMIDTSVLRVHCYEACIADNNHQDMGRLRGGQSSKIHAVVNTKWLAGPSRSRPAFSSSILETKNENRDMRASPPMAKVSRRRWRIPAASSSRRQSPALDQVMSLC